MIGCGGLGSTAAVILAKMGAPKIHLYDMDTVDDVNIANQFFGPHNLGQNKVKAIAENIEMFSGANCGIPHHGEIENTMDISNLGDNDIVILALDSNDTRRWFYQEVINEFPSWKKLNIFDTRMGGLTFDVFFSTNTNAKETLADTPVDADVPDDLCTAKAIAFNTFGCSSFLAAMLRKHLRGEGCIEKREHIQICMQNNILINLLQ